MDNIEIEYEYKSIFIPYQEKQIKILQYVSNNRYFGYLSGLFYIYHYMIKRPFATAMNIIGLYLINDLSVSLNINLASYFVFLIIGILKDFIKIPRPRWLHPSKFKIESAIERSYSFPSGHTGSIITLLIMTIYFQHTITTGMFIVQLILMPISRLYLCVHWVSDVFFSLLLVVILSALWIGVSPVAYICGSMEDVLLYTFIFQFIVFLLYYVIVEFFKGVFKEPSDITKKIGIQLKPIHHGTNVVKMISNMGLYIGLYVNWYYGYVHFPRIYSTFNCMYISIMFYGSVLYCMNGAVYLFEKVIDQRPSTIYYIRGIFYFIAMFGSMVIPNLII